MRHEIYGLVNPNRIDMLTKLIEAYHNLGIVSTVDQSSGRVVIRVTEDTWAEIMDILHNLPFEIDIENSAE